MAIDFSKYLPVERQKEIITAQLQAWAQDHYANSVTAKINNETGNTEVAKQAEANMAAIEAAAVVAEAELAALDTPVSE